MFDYVNRRKNYKADRRSATELSLNRSRGAPNHASDWLFPGRNAGQPAAYHYIAGLLRDHGLPLRTARISALRQLVLAVPAPVVADALGFHHTTTTRQHINAGATWSRYVAGERPGRHPRQDHDD